MSWKAAKLQAAAWLRELKFPTDLRGQTIDLPALGEKLEHPDAFRLMVLRAVARELRHRGAKIK